MSRSAEPLRLSSCSGTRLSEPPDTPAVLGGSLIWRFFLAVLGGFSGLWRFWRLFGGSGGSWRFFSGSGGFSWRSRQFWRFFGSSDNLVREPTSDGVVGGAQAGVPVLRPVDRVRGEVCNCHHKSNFEYGRLCTHPRGSLPARCFLPEYPPSVIGVGGAALRGGGAAGGWGWWLRGVAPAVSPQPSALSPQQPASQPRPQRDPMCPKCSQGALWS